MADGCIHQSTGKLCGNRITFLRRSWNWLDRKKRLSPCCWLQNQITKILEAELQVTIYTPSDNSLVQKLKDSGPNKDRGDLCAVF